MDERFLRFFSIVQEAAKSEGRVFFLDCGEGHDLTTDDIDCEDLSGWLVDSSDVDEFEPIWLERRLGDMPERLMDSMVTAVWSGEPGSITVEFVPVP